MHPDQALDVATLVLRYAIIGMAVTNINCNGPAIFIGAQRGGDRQGHIGAAEGFQRCEAPKGLGALGPLGGLKVRSPDHHDPHRPSG